MSLCSVLCEIGVCSDVLSLIAEYALPRQTMERLNDEFKSSIQYCNSCGSPLTMFENGIEFTDWWINDDDLCLCRGCGDVDIGLE